MKMKTRKKTASVARDLRVAVSATATTNARNADAGLRAKASVATTTNARSVDAGLRAEASVATITNAKSVVVDADAGTVGDVDVSAVEAKHVELEEKIAKFKGTEAAVTFSSAYAANASAVQVCVYVQDVCLFLPLRCVPS